MSEHKEMADPMIDAKDRSGKVPHAMPL